MPAQADCRNLRSRSRSIAQQLLSEFKIANFTIVALDVRSADTLCPEVTTVNERTGQHNVCVCRGCPIDDQETDFVDGHQSIGDVQTNPRLVAG